MKTNKNLIVLLSLLFLGISPEVFAQQTSKPNVIYIMVDDLGYRDLGCYGQELIETPRIDRMAAEGMRFTDCYSGHGVCAPARSVLMTGLHTGHTPIRDNRALVGGTEGARGHARISFDDEVVTTAEVLKSAGYTTGLTGKWGLGEPGTDGVPNKQGFDEFYGYLNQAHAHNHWPNWLWHNTEKVDLGKRERGLNEYLSHHLFTEFSLNFIRENQAGPFFLYVAYTLPHWPLKMSDYGQYADKEWDDNAKAYAAMVSLIDRDTGRILDLLEELGIAENTLVFFCSDNGASSRWDGLFNSCGEMQGDKGSQHEGGIRVPMIAWQPGSVPAGVVDDTPWYFADVLPTLAELAGADAEVPENIDGVSVLPTLRGQEQDLSERFMHWENTPGNPEGRLRQASRRGQWKAMRTYGSDHFELFDLSENHAEATNVAGEHPEIVAQFRQFMDQAHIPSPHWPHRDSGQAK